MGLSPSAFKSSSGVQEYMSIESHLAARQALANEFYDRARNSLEPTKREYWLARARTVLMGMKRDIQKIPVMSVTVSPVGEESE